MEKPTGLLPVLCPRFQMMGTAMSTMVTLWVNCVITLMKIMNPMRKRRMLPSLTKLWRMSLSTRLSPAPSLLIAAETGMDAASIHMTFQLMPEEPPVRRPRV